MRKKNIGRILAWILVSVILWNGMSAESFAKTTKTNLPQKTSFTTKTRYGMTYVKLSWTKSKDASGYQIYRREGTKEKFVLVKTIKKANTLSWKDTGLKKEKTYYYKIRAYKNVKKTVVYGKCSNLYKKKRISSEAEAVKQYKGVRYVSGGCSPKGWDCSGFTKWAMKEYYGVDIPKGAAMQGTHGKKISKTKRSTWKPGDILVYSSGGRIGHVALYLGDGKLMHALSEKYGTIIQDVDYYERWDGGTYLVGVRRYI